MTQQKAAFLVVPHTGGTFTVFTALREALASLNVALDWVGITSSPQRILSDPAFHREMARGRLIDSSGRSPAENGAALLEVLSGYQIVFINVLTSLLEMSVAAYLPDHVKRVMIVHSITPGTYSAAKAVAPYVHAVVGVAPRVKDDLRKRLNLNLNAIYAIPNALSFQAYDHFQRGPDGPTSRLLSLGRIVDADKGVYWLPRILQNLVDVPVHLTIAGDGPDLPELHRRCEPYKTKCTFLGRISPGDVPHIMASHDVLLMPSRFEGFGYTLIEAMAGGCVPVASRISGTTDFVVQDDITGMLFPIGDVIAAASKIRRLVQDVALREKMAIAGAQDVRNRFSVEAMARNYEPVLRDLHSAPHIANRHGQPFVPLKIGGGWRRFVPTGIKNMLRARMMR
ncbi:MAG: glycosyltransferase family 4 protein [Phycisphaerae bacterium]